jgi:hypothetical protein
MTKDERRIPVLLAKLADLYQVKANRVRQEKGAAHLHTRRLERIAGHLRAAHDGIVGER